MIPERDCARPKFSTSRLLSPIEFGDPTATQRRSTQGPSLGSSSLNRFLFLLLVFGASTLAFSPAVVAQSSPEISQLPSKPDPHVGMTVPAWLALSFAGQVAALADVKTTLSLRNGDPRFTDEDPFANPIIKLPTPAYVTVAVAFTSIISVAGLEMHKSPHRWERRVWWIPQAIQIAINTGSSMHNASLPRWSTASQRHQQ
jgi:hypothetical protein